MSRKFGNQFEFPSSEDLKVELSWDYGFKVTGSRNLKHRFKVIQDFGKMHKNSEEKMSVLFHNMFGPGRE